jgi:hypothetical protein
LSQACIWRSQNFRGDGTIKFETSSKLPARNIQVVNSNDVTAEIFWTTSVLTGEPLLIAQEMAGYERRPMPNQVFTIEMVNRHALYRDATDQLILRSDEKPLTGEWYIQVQFGLLGGAPQELKRVTVLPRDPEVFIYTEDMQVADFGAVQSDLYLRVRRLSLNPNVPPSPPLLIHGTA